MPPTLLTLLLWSLRPLSPAVTPQLGLLQAMRLAASAAEAPGALTALAAQLVPARAQASRGPLALPPLVALLGQVQLVLLGALDWTGGARTLGAVLGERAEAQGLPAEAGWALVPEEAQGLTGPDAQRALRGALAQVAEALSALGPGVRPPVGTRSGTFDAVRAESGGPV